MPQNNNNPKNQLDEDKYRVLQAFLNFTKRGLSPFTFPCQYAVYENTRKQLSQFQTFSQRSARVKICSTIPEVIEVGFFFENTTQWVKCWYCGTTSFNCWRYWSISWVGMRNEHLLVNFLLQK